MTGHGSPQPHHYVTAIRALLGFALIMLVVGLLADIAFQESAKKVSRAPNPSGLGYLDAVLQLALVHGHILVAGVLIPVAMACILDLARACGGTEISRRSLRWILYTFLPFVTSTAVLMLYNGYHLILSVRAGETDLSRIDETLLAGSKALRHGLYGLSHTGMGFGLCLFAWYLWRSLRGRMTARRTGARDREAVT